MGGGGGGGRVRYGTTPNETVQDGNAPAKTVSGHSGWRGWVHLGLGVLEFVPIPLVSGTAGAVDAGMYIQEGSYGDAAAAGLSAIPGEKFFAVLGKGIKYFKDAREAKAAVKEAEEAKRIEQEAKDGESVAKKKEEEQKGCPGCSGAPVVLHNGVKILHHSDFTLPGLLPIELTHTFVSNMTFDGPLGRNRISPLDEFFSKQDDGTWLYRTGTDRTVVFDRPAPNPGVTSRGRGFPNLFLSAARRGGFHLKDDAVLKHFVKFKDGVCRLAEIRDLNDNAITFHREADGLLTRIERSDGLAFLFDNDAKGRRISTTLRAPTGETRLVTRFTYDTRGNLVEARNSYAKSRRYEYDEANRFLAYDDGVNERCEYSYDAEGRVCAVRTPGGCFDHTFSYEPDERATTLAYTARADATTRYTFDEHGMTLTETNGLGHVRSYERNSKGTLLAVIDGEGNRTAYTYDTFGNVSTITDPEARRTTYRHNTDGGLEKLIDPAGSVWSWDYDLRGNLVATCDPLGYRTDFSNDAAGQPTAIMRHDGLIEQRVYDAQHNLVRLVDFRGGTTRYERDVFGRVVATTDALGHETRYAYAEVPGVDFWTPCSVFRADGAKLLRHPQPDRSVETIIDGEGRRTTSHYGPFDLLELIEDPKGGRLRFSYDCEKRLTRVTNQIGRDWTFERDAAGRVVREIDFDGLVVAYDYERGAQAVSITHADGTRVVNGFDKVGRLTREETWELEAAAPKVTTFAYDARGQVREARNEAALVTFERDAFGRMVAETINGRRVESTYDCCGNRVERRLDAKTVSQKFDPMGAVHEIEIDGHAPLIFLRDALGRERRRATEPGFALDQTYDTVGRLVDQVAGTPAALSLRRRYAWNAAFEPTAIRDNRWGETTYRHDANGQVIEGRHGDDGLEHFGYDAALNLVAAGELGPTQFASSDSARAISPGGRVIEGHGPHGEYIRLTYDARGQVVERRLERFGFRPVKWRYRWDGKGRLVGCLTPKDEQWAYGYDPFGRRLWKRRVATDRPSRGLDGRDQPPHPVGTFFGWDGDLLCEEAPLGFDGAPDWISAVRWHYEPGSFRPLARESADGVLLNVVTDHLGTPREMLDETGKLVWAAEYRIWGAMRRVWMAANDNASEPESQLSYVTGNVALALAPVAQEREAAAFCPIRFQGQWFDEEMGLCYNRFRYYDIVAAQYLRPDPIGLSGGLQSFAYVNNTTYWVDPFGLAKKKCCDDPCATDASGRPLSSPNYSNWSNVQLPDNLMTTSDRSQFQFANEQLYNNMQANPEFGNALKGSYPGLSSLGAGPRGAFPGGPPASGLTWHHSPNSPGTLELVPTDQHKAPGPVQQSLHPGCKGGKANWGGGR